MKYGLEYAGSRRVRRGWGACVVRAGLLVVLVAFLIWLVGSVLWVLAETLEVSSFRFQVSSGLPLAMAATGGGVSPWVATVVAWGVLSLCLVGIGVHAWRRVMEWYAVGEFVDDLQAACAGEEAGDRLKPGLRTGEPDHGLVPAATTSCADCARMARYYRNELERVQREADADVARRIEVMNNGLVPAATTEGGAVR